MSSKILLRRGTAAQWTSANPTLGVGELGIETDTLKIKVGNGSSTWTQLTNYINVTPSGLSNSLGDYILLANQGNAGGPAELDSNGNLLIPENSAIFWNDPTYSYTTTLTTTQPTENRVITFPNATGTVALTSDITSAVTNLINAAPSTLDTLNELAAAINNDSSFSTTVNNLLSGKVSKSGGDTITSATTSTIGLIIKATTSQTANILEIQNPTAGVIFAVTPTAEVISYRKFSVFAPSASTTGLIVKGSASQTANLQEWQNNAGTALTKIDNNAGFYAQYIEAKNTAGVLVSGESQIKIASPDGLKDIRFWNRNDAGGLYYYNSSGGSKNILRIAHSTDPRVVTQTWQDFTSGNSANYGGRINIDTSITTAIGMVIRGVVSQTANLQEWQNSGGGIVSYVTSSGAISSNTAITATSFVKSGGTASQFLKADGSTDSSTYLNSTTSSYVAGHHPEGRILASAALVNDLGNARLRGSTFTFTNISPSNSDIDKMFDGTANFLMISPTSSQTFPIVIEFTLPRTLSWGAVVGIGFGTSTWRTNSVKIEAFSEGAWVTCIDTTTNTSEDVLVGIPGNLGTGTTKLRYTLANPNSSQLRICHLWAYNYNSDMWTHLQMPRAGGTMYGALSTKGAISVLNSSNTATSYLNQDGSGALAVTDPFGGIGWSIYGNLGIRTSGASGGQAATVTIGSMTQASNTAALTLYGHTEFGSLTNSAPIQTWSKADGTLLAKVDQFGAFTVNINSASSVPLTLKAASSQTANIQEWKTSANVAKLAVDSNGFIRFDDQTSAPTIKWGNATVWESVGGTASMRINPYGPGYIGLIVKGADSQTANLQEWQDSAGTVLAKVTATGKLDITPSSGNTINFRNSSGGLTLWGGNSSYFMNTGLYMTGGSWAAGRLGIDTQGASNIGLVVRGAASQTANLQEWQDSAGTIKSYIASDGSFSSSIDATINSLTIGRGGGNQISNVAIGLAALLSNTTGVGNTQIGLSSGQNITTGSYNVGVGNYTNLSLTTGISNTSIGTSAGSTITTGSNITVLGYDAEPSSPTISNEITLGNASVTKLRIPGIGVDWTSSALNIGSDRVLTSQDEKNIYITDSGTARTLGSSDAYKILEFTSSSSITVTIPNDASDTTFPIGSYVEVRQMGGGQIIVSATSPATLVATDNQYKTRVQYSAIVLEKRASNAWYLAGDTTA